MPRVSLPSSPSILRRSSSRQMEHHDFSSELNDNYQDVCGGAVMPVHITSHQRYNSTSRRKSNVRLNDELIPKPTDIIIGNKMPVTATPKEHPYSSHISRFAMFPSFRSPDDPRTGVRAASQTFLNPLIPNSAPDVTVISKTIGGAYRHEILETARKKAVMWPGEHGFLDHTKPLMGKRQVFYPAPPKTVLPNSKLRDFDLSLSERASNMLKNLEKALWITSYQMHYTGSGPANPLKIDDYEEKMSDLAGMNSHTAPLRERSYPVFVPCKPKQGWRRRPVSCEGKSPPHTTVHQHGPQNEAPGVNPEGPIQSGNISEAQKAELSETKSLLPRPPVLPSIDPVDRVGTEGAPLSLHVLQNSFSKSEAHRNFNSSITHAAVNLRDNVVTGRKHDFYGINSYYLHG